MEKLKKDRISQLLLDAPYDEAIQAKIKWNTDYIGKQNDYFIIKGWMLMEGEDVGDQEKIVEMISDSGKVMRYKADTYPRVDLLELTSIENCISAGLICEIPYSDMEGIGKINLDYYIREKDQLYTADVNESFDLK